MAYSRQDLLDAIAKFKELDEDASIVRVSDELYAECKKLYPIFEQFANEGDADAECYLGALIWRGKGVAVNELKAEELFKKSALKGNAFAQYLMGKFTLDYYSYEGVDCWKKANEWFIKSAEQGFAPAQNELAYSYESRRGVDTDYEKAAYWYEKAAEQGYQSALMSLGTLYYYGRGVEQNTQKAISLWQQAYDQGYIYASASIGRCYFEGKGIEKDLSKALRLYQEALDYSGGRIVDYQKKIQAIKDELKKQGRCQHCGGKIKGLFFKKCANCGRKKDYK